MTTDADLIAALSRATAATAAAAAARVVRIEESGRSFSGLVWAQGWIVTAEERLQGDEAIVAVLPDGGRAPAELAGRDPSTDVALLRVETGPAPAWPEAAAPAVGGLALAVGQGGHGPVAAFGAVAEAGPAWTSAAGGRIDARLRLSFPLPHAVEGGAVVDVAGGLIGMAVADPRRRTLAIPAATIARAVAALAERGYVGRGYLGLALQPLRGGGGLIAVEVEAGGPAAASGLLVGDIVHTWDGEPLEGMRALAGRLGPDAVGRVVRLGLTRAGEAVEASVRIEERRPKGGGAAKG